MEKIKVKNKHVRSFGIVFLKYKNLFQIEFHLGKTSIILGF